ncbi:unnamed protein product [Prunus armeniaca]
MNVDEHQLWGCRIGMSDTESDYSGSPRAFEGESASESSIAGLESIDFLEVSTESRSTSRGVAEPREGVLTEVTGRQRVPMAKPKGLVFGVDRLELNAMTEAELAKIRALYNIPDSRAVGVLEQLERVTRAKSADQEGWVQSNCLSEGQRRHVVVGMPSSQKTWRRRCVLVSGAWESAPGVILERHVPTSFQTVVSLKRPIATKRKIEVIERIQSRIAEEDRFFRTLLDYKNLFKAGLIDDPEYSRRK